MCHISYFCQVIGGLGGAKKLISKMTAPLSDLQKVQNLIARHMKTHTTNLSSSEYSHLMETITETAKMLNHLKEDPLFLKKAMESLEVDELVKMSEMVMVTTGDGGAMRRLPLLMQVIMPQVSVLSRYQDGIRTLADHLLQEGVTSFLYNFNIIKGGDEVRLFGVC